jgi:PAS domain S-box-containing protein
MEKFNLSEVIEKYKELEEEYTEVLNKYKDLEKVLKRHNLTPYDLLSVDKSHQYIIPHNNADVVWMMDLKGKMTFVSPSIKQFIGYTEKEYLALSIDDIFSPESAKKVKSAINQKRIDEFKKLIKESQDVSFDIELEYRCKDGSIKWGEVKVTPVFDEYGDFIAINGVTKDISEQIKNKFIISQQELQFVELLEHFPNMVYIHCNNKLVYANQAGKEALNITDINAEEIDIFSRVKESCKPLLKEMMDLRMKGETVDSFQLEVLDGFNRYRNVIVRSRNVVFNNQPSVLFMITDITDQLETEKTIHESETKFSTLANFSPYAIMIYQDDYWIYANPAATTICEYSLEELYAMKFWDFIHPDFVEMAKMKSMEKYSGRDELSEYEFKIITKSGLEKWVQLIGNKIAFNDKDAIIISVSDVTKQKHEAEELEDAKNRAEASDRLKTAFLNNISHEIRTPLNGILNFGEMLIDPTETEENKKFYFNILDQSIERLLDTINDYMDISLIVSKNAIVHTQEFDIRACVEDIRRKYIQAIDEKSLNFSVSVRGFENDIIYSDEEMFSKILKHLISNAIKFTPKNGSISVRVHNKENLLNIEVEDDGTGISESVIAEIFLPFNQGDNSSSRKYEGSGLGLAIIKGLVDVLHGAIHIDSTDRKGTQFNIQIPIEIMKEPEIEIVANPLHVNKALPILIVEDEVTNRLFLRILLERYGFDVVEVADGRQAVDTILSSVKFSVILMDIKMPVMNGIEATRQIKAIDNTIPIIATTAYAMSGDEQSVLDAGCDDYISKPIVKDVLFSKLKRFGLM